MNRSIDIELAELPVVEQPQPSEPAMPGACRSGGCGGTPAPLRPPAPSFAPVSVNGVEIRAEDIAREMQHHPADALDDSWRAAAGALALRELLLQQARRDGLAAEPETDAAGGREADEDALVRALLEHAVKVEPPGVEECRRVYDAERHRFRTAELFEAAHILIEPDDDLDWDGAGRKAREVASGLGDGREAFAAAARALSGCPSANQDGSLGQIRRGELVAEVQAALEALEPGTTGREPVRSRFGWHVLRLERRIPGRELPFEVVRDKIADMLEARAWAIAASRYVAGLVDGARVEGVVLEPPAQAGW